jgi:hypothetical protein
MAHQRPGVVVASPQPHHPAASILAYPLAARGACRPDRTSRPSTTSANWNSGVSRRTGSTRTRPGVSAFTVMPSPPQRGRAGIRQRRSRGVLGGDRERRTRHLDTGSSSCAASRLASTSAPPTITPRGLSPGTYCLVGNPGWARRPGRGAARRAWATSQPVPLCLTAALQLGSGQSDRPAVGAVQAEVSIRAVRSRALILPRLLIGHPGLAGSTSGPARGTLTHDDRSSSHPSTRGPASSSPAPLLRLRGRTGRRGGSPPPPQVSLPLRRPERGTTDRAPSSAQGGLSILSVCAQARQAPSSRAVSALQSDGHARGSHRDGAGTRQAPAESWLHGVRRPLWQRLGSQGAATTRARPGRSRSGGTCPLDVGRSAVQAGQDHLVAGADEHRGDGSDVGGAGRAAKALLAAQVVGQVLTPTMPRSGRPGRGAMPFPYW